MITKVIKLKPINFFCRDGVKKTSKVLSGDALRVLLFFKVIDPDGIGVQYSDYLLDALNLTYQRATIVLKELEVNNYIEIELRQLGEAKVPTVRMPYRPVEHENKQMRKEPKELSKLALQILEEFKSIPQSLQVSNKNIRQCAKKFREPFAKVEQALYELINNDWAVAEVQRAIKVANNSEGKEESSDDSQKLKLYNLTRLETRLIGYFQFLAPDNGEIALHIDELAEVFKVSQDEINQAILRLFKTDRLSLDIVKALVRVN
jgi:hypothetical protein